MKYVFLTNIVSPHQLPWCREWVKLVGCENFLYVAKERLHGERSSLGWGNEQASWIRLYDQSLAEVVENCDVLITSLREFDLIEYRSARKLRTYYMFERWFKPPSGMLRMLHPEYFFMCRRALRCFESPFVRLLPIGVFAVRDVVLMHRMLHCNFFRVRLADAMKRRHLPMEKIEHSTLAIRLWGYYVEKSRHALEVRSKETFNIMWCGRMLDWKHVETVIEAAGILLEAQVPLRLILIGQGGEEQKLKSLAGKRATSANNVGIYFSPPEDIRTIRSIMRDNDVYVLASDAGEGWGAVANEAMNEGTICVGTYEAGSSATMIDDGMNGFLYHAKDIDKLADILFHVWRLKKNDQDAEIRLAARRTITSEWSPEYAATSLLNDVRTWTL